MHAFVEKRGRKLRIKANRYFVIKFSNEDPETSSPKYRDRHDDRRVVLLGWIGGDVIRMTGGDVNV